MADQRLKRAIGQLAAALRDRDEGDGELLELFVQHRDESAFEALLLRHGPMVLGVCRRMLGNHHDAEDAFQATFLVLARKAASVQPPRQVGNWLYGVAHRTALEARRAAVKRRAKEAKAVSGNEETRNDVRELREMLDGELASLPPAYREVVVLCDLEQRGRQEVAGLLGCPEGTVASRLSRARDLLARRLARHGLAVATGPVAAMLPPDALLSAVPAPLADATLKGAVLFGLGHDIAGAVPPRIAALAEEVLRIMFTNRLTKTALLLLVALLAVGAGLVSVVNATHPGERTVQKKEAKEPAPKPIEDKEVTGDLKKLQGTWLPTDGTRSIWLIAGGKITEYSLHETEGRQGEMSIDPAKRPRTIDISFPSIGRKLGIYEIEGDTLKVCLAGANTSRPTEFKARSLAVPGQRHFLLVFKRHSTKLVGFSLAWDIGKAYKENDALADEKYTDKQVTVMGSVERIKRHGAGYALLAESGGNNPLLFEFAIKARGELAKLKSGQVVIVQGQCKGMVKDKSGQETIAFSECKLVEPN
jgi:RNA polymerase sigma factor (sigma-70 family)